MNARSSTTPIAELQWRPSCSRLTVKLRGRPEAADQAPRAHNLFRARGAQPPTVHGPLQRLLDVTPSKPQPWSECHRMAYTRGVTTESRMWLQNRTVRTVSRVGVLGLNSS
jgi:hypothetical protein